MADSFQQSNRFGDIYTSDLETSDEEEVEHIANIEGPMYQTNRTMVSQSANVVEGDTFWIDHDARETISTRRIFFDDDDDENSDDGL